MICLQNAERNYLNLPNEIASTCRILKKYLRISIIFTTFAADFEM